jgi:hypothetical protein
LQVVAGQLFVSFVGFAIAKDLLKEFLTMIHQNVAGSVGAYLINEWEPYPFVKVPFQLALLRS